MKADGALAQKVGLDYRLSADTVFSIEGNVREAEETADPLNTLNTDVDKSMSLKVKRSF